MEFEVTEAFPTLIGRYRVPDAEAMSQGDDLPDRWVPHTALASGQRLVRRVLRGCREQNTLIIR
jgi:hypothetical protein